MGIKTQAGGMFRNGRPISVLLLALAAVAVLPAWAREAPPAREHDATSVREVSLGFGMASWRLPAHLAVPPRSSRAPAIVLVPPVGTQGQGEQARLLRAMALGLAEHGVVTMWYEKRLHRWEAQMAALPRGYTASQETVIDAALATRVLRERADVDPTRIHVLALGTAGILVPRILRLAPRIRGAILVSPPALPLHLAVLRAAKAQAPGRVQDVQRLEAQMAKVSGGTLAKGTTAADLPLGLPPSYWQDLRGYEGPRWMAEVRRPLLFLQPGDDPCVPASDLDTWKDALRGRPGATFVTLPGLDGDLTATTGTSAKGDARPGPTRSALQLIARWVHGAP